MKNKQKAFEEGFTLTEAVVAILILSLASVLLFIGGHRFLESYDDIKARNIFISEAVQCDSMLKTSLNDIRIPYWERELEINTAENMVVLPYLGGNKDAEISLSFSDMGFRISLDEENFIIYSSITDGDIYPFKIDGITIGLSIILFDARNNEYECRALFGSIPLMMTEDYE